jgi:hypothetical protein
MTVGSGRQLSMLLNVSSPLGAFSKILLESSHWASSEEYCYVWNRLDTKFGLSAFQLTPWGQNTGDSGCSLWRTPTRDAAERKMDGEERLKAGFTLNLSDQAATPKLWPTPRKEGYDAQGKDHGDLVYEVKNRLWPTPSAGNFNDGESLETWEARRQANKAKGINGNGQGTPLSIAAKLWPTPIRKDAEQGSGRGHHLNPAADKKAGTRLYEAAIRMDDSPSGSLNPRFVEELMGYPIDHTALKRSATPSSHNRCSLSSQQSRM